MLVRESVEVGGEDGGEVDSVDGDVDSDDRLWKGRMIDFRLFVMISDLEPD